METGSRPLAHTVPSSYCITSNTPQIPATSPASMSNATPHPVQSNVLAMCQAIIPTNHTTSSSATNDETTLGPMASDTNNDWFFQLTGQPQSVIVAPTPRTQTSPNSSRRAVRIQIINKHDDIVLPPPTLLPMTPPPPSSSSLVFDDSTPTLVEYLVNSCNMFHLTNNSQHQLGFPHNIDDPTGRHQIKHTIGKILNQTMFMIFFLEYETFPDPSITQLTDLDQQYDSSGWIDTPLSNFGANSIDMVSSSPYSSYDFLCLWDISLTMIIIDIQVRFFFFCFSHVIFLLIWNYNFILRRKFFMHKRLDLS